MARRSILTGTVLLVLAACGDGVTEPPVETAVETDMYVEIDWPLAREPWFVAYGWKLMGYDPDWTPKTCTFDEPYCPTPQSRITLQEGTFPPTGVTRLRFTSLCEPGEYQSGYPIDLFGMKKSTPHGLQCVYCGCSPIFPALNCTDALQKVTVPAPSDDDRCSVEAWVETDIDLRLDWSLAREPGFTGARWTLLEREPDPDQYGSQWVAVDGGMIPEDGVAEVRFRTFCEPGSDRYLNHKVEVSGHFVAYEESLSDLECRLGTWNFDCTSELQVETGFHIPGSFGDPPAQCSPPSD